jgi:hypothetical protein
MKRMHALVILLIIGTSGIAQEKEKTPSVPTISTETGLVGKWKADTSTLAMDDSRAVALYVDAEEQLAISSPLTGTSTSITPQLFVRCRQGKFEVYVHIGYPASVEVHRSLLTIHAQDHTVRLRIDSQKAFSERWRNSTDLCSFFAPHPKEIAKSTASAQKLAFEFTPFVGTPTVLTFDVRGLDHNLNVAMAACKK